MKANHILETIGNTPHVRLSRLFPENFEVWMKMERSNPGGSIKDRIALSMIEEAEKAGILKEGSVIIEPTSGNTGIGLALVAAVKKYRLILVMPESMSIERRSVMAALGAEMELTSRSLGMKGAIDRAQELAREIPGAWIPQQFENPANPKIHEMTTAREILIDFPEGFDFLVTGVGTGGHITGVARVLKKKFPGMEVYAVEPELSAVLGGGEPGPHPLQGIGAGFIPSILDINLLSGAIPVGKEAAFVYARRLAREEGIFAGISTGASLAAVAHLISNQPPGTRILTFCYDTGERYFSVDDLFQ
ncbi:MAG TPA: cysteine synthase A [Bacteroidetes bacterium]|nr:cysteine synthase A [Bacteroidota bacterium]